jgi:peptide/nickel transport system substrate-binding protein
MSTVSEREHLMRVTKRASALGVTAVLAVALAACGTAGQGGPTGPEETPESLASRAPEYNPQPYDNIRDGGTLTTAIPEINPQFNVFQADTTADTRTIWNWYNPMFITFSPEGEAQFNPDFLTDVREENVDGNTRITYTIHPEARFNDGTPIDWRVFEATWTATNGRNPAYLVSSTDGYDRTTSVTPGVDDRQAVVTFDGVNVWWEGLFNNVLHPAALAPEVFNQGYLNTPHAEWGAGPYAVERFDQQTGAMSFTRNPNWWGDPGKLDTRTFLTMEASASINAFRNGQIDAVGVSTNDRLSQVKDMPGIEIRRSTTPAIFLFTLNSASPVLRDPQVRKAIFQGIDRVQLGEILFQGLGYREDPPGSLILLPFQKGYEDNFSRVLTYDPAAAGAALDAAGWPAGPDGVRVKDGQPLQFTFVQTGDTPTIRAVASAVAAMMREIGVNLEVRQVPSSDFSKITANREFDMFFSGFRQSDPFGVAYICQVYCSGSQLNMSGTNDPAFDAEVQSVNTLPTPEKQFAKANEVEVRALGTHGLMPVYNGPTIVAVKQGLANMGADLFFDALPQNIGWQK